MSSPAGEYHIVIQENETFRFNYTWKLNDVGVDLTGWTGQMQVRRRPNSPVLLEASTTPGVGLGTMTLDDEGGVDIVFDSSLLESLDFQTASYDVLLTDSTGGTWRRLQGNVTYSRAITDDEDES